MEDLDWDCLKELVSHLGGQNTMNLGLVNKSWTLKLFSSQSDPIIWQFLCHHQFNFSSPTMNQTNPNHFRRKWCQLRDWRKTGKSLEEHFNIPNEESRGVIQFLHGFGFGIKVGNKKISYSWPIKFDGSLVRYYLRGHRLGDSLLEDIQKVQCLLNEGLIDTSESLKSQFWTFLRLFQPGNYQMNLHYSPQPSKFYPPFSPFNYRKKGYPYTSLACFDEGHSVQQKGDPAIATCTEYYYYQSFNRYHIIFTQSMSTINRERVEYYKKMIEKRTFPIILALHVNSDDFYILDGHHKYIAYKEMNIFNPVILAIQPKIFLDQSPHLPLDWYSPFVSYCRECINWCKGVEIFEEGGEEEEFVKELDPNSLVGWKVDLKYPLLVFKTVGYSETAEPTNFHPMYLPTPAWDGEEEIEEIKE